MDRMEAFWEASAPCLKFLVLDQKFKKYRRCFFLSSVYYKVPVPGQVIKKNN